MTFSVTMILVTICFNGKKLMHSEFVDFLFISISLLFPFQKSFLAKFCILMFKMFKKTLINFNKELYSKNSSQRTVFNHVSYLNI